jgi:hypothetical protein
MTFVLAHFGHWYHALIYLAPVLVVMVMMWRGGR